MFNAAGEEVTKNDDAVKIVYIVELQKMIEGTSTSSIMYSAMTSKGKMVIELPTAVQKSGVPLSGKYKVKCVNSNNQASYTKEMHYHTHPYWVVNYIMNDCQGLYDKLEYINSPERPQPRYP